MLIFTIAITLFFGFVKGWDFLTVFFLVGAQIGASIILYIIEGFFYSIFGTNNKNIINKKEKSKCKDCNKDITITEKEWLSENKERVVKYNNDPKWFSKRCLECNEKWIKTQSKCNRCKKDILISEWSWLEEKKMKKMMHYNKSKWFIYSCEDCLNKKI